MALFDYSGNYMIPKTLKGRNTIVTPWEKRNTTFFKKDKVEITPWAPRGEMNFPSTFPLSGLGDDYGGTGTVDRPIFTVGNGVKLPLPVYVDKRGGAVSYSLNTSGYPAKLGRGLPKALQDYLISSYKSFEACKAQVGLTASVTPNDPRLKCGDHNAWNKTVATRQAVCSGKYPLSAIEYKGKKYYVFLKATNKSIPSDTLALTKIIREHRTWEITLREPTGHIFARAAEWGEALVEKALEVVGDVVGWAVDEIGGILNKACPAAQGPIAKIGEEVVNAKTGQVARDKVAQAKSFVQKLCGAVDAPPPPVEEGRSWLLPAAAVGGGIVLLLLLRKKRSA